MAPHTTIVAYIHLQLEAVLPFFLKQQTVWVKAILLNIQKNKSNTFW
jgi:hypothetical protein